MSELTPRQIVHELDKYIIGQDDAKRCVAVALRNRWRRRQLPADLRDEVAPKNIIMIGPTGVGKTEIARRIAALVKAPFNKVEASKYTEVGYVGRDVESIIRELVDISINMVRDEALAAVAEPAAAAAEERLLDALLPGASRDGDEARPQTRDRLRDMLRAGRLEDREVEIAIEERPQVGMIAGMAGSEEMSALQDVFERIMPSRTRTRRVTVAEARDLLAAQESEKLIDRDSIVTEAMARAQDSGIVFIDELDKVAGGDPHHGPDVSRQGVQRDLLPIVEGSAVSTRHGIVRTDHVLFIAAGAFHMAKPSDLMPELQGRFPIRVELKDLTKDDFVRILTEPRNALTRQQRALMATEGLLVEFADDAVETIADMAFDINQRTLNIGARLLYTVMEKLFETISFDAPDLETKDITIDAAYVREQLKDIVGDDDLARYIL